MDREDWEERKKLFRPDDEPESKEAALAVDLKGDQALVKKAIEDIQEQWPGWYPTRADLAEFIAIGRFDPEGREQRARVESLRRRVSDLTNDGFLVKTGEKRGREATLMIAEEHA